ncbi:MAG: DUF4197 domain-containing protein [Methylococcales bacterium]|jgi:hypothetical protein|nr:DUF4197 domain-containing protein [Methylococcales bacterium]MBT7445534.1 DUF4197 domain-containing protein [Methylococcales bacterium]
MAGGLKEALILGSKKAIQLLSQDGGYLNDDLVRIPIPEKLQFAEKALRATGQSQMVDEFISTMNHAAEEAVPQAVDIFSDSITNMTLEDARGILTGPEDSATQYFKRSSTAQLMSAMLPIVKAATAKTGVTESYKRYIGLAEPYIQSGGRQASGLIDSFGGLGGLGDTAKQYADKSAGFDAESMDIDNYVAQKALDGLFFKLAEEERLIRTDPIARSTDLLKKVFGSN